MTHTIVIICRTPRFCFYSIDFQLNADFPSQFYLFFFFTVKSLISVNQRSVSQENAFKKSKTPSAFILKTIGSNNSFALFENNFRFLRLQSLNSRYQYTMAYGQNAPSCEPLSYCPINSILPDHNGPSSTKQHMLPGIF